MSDYFVMFLCLICWGMGFISCWFYSTLKIRRIEIQNANLMRALHCAGNTIMNQSEEIHTILIHAQKCDSELIN